MEKKSLHGTRTEQNLLKAFAGESQAKNRYTFFAKQASKEGYEVIARYFEETANNEEHHAKEFFKFLEGGMVEITAAYPAGMIGTTAQNLLAAAEGEYDEWADLYPEFAKVAQEEGFPHIAVKFRLITAVEKDHERRFRKLLEVLQAGEMFKKDDSQEWRCMKCGYVHKSKTAPEKCPICDHPQAFFEIMDDKF